MLDSLVEWFDLRWRSVLYSFLAGILFTVACTWCSDAHAAGYPKPAGAPEVFVPTYSVTVAIVAVKTGVGDGIGILENNGNGVWNLCGYCIVQPEMPNLDAVVAAAGGPGPYVASQLGNINFYLAQRYPPIVGDLPTLDAVNQAVATYVLRLVNGSPVLGAK